MFILLIMHSVYSMVNYPELEYIISIIIFISVLVAMVFLLFIMIDIIIILFLLFSYYVEVVLRIPPKL